jgi:hypothetical protein
MQDFDFDEEHDDNIDDAEEIQSFIDIIDRMATTLKTPRASDPRMLRIPRLKSFPPSEQSTCFSDR